MIGFPGPVACTGVCNAGGGGAFCFSRRGLSFPVSIVVAYSAKSVALDMGDGHARVVSDQHVGTDLSFERRLYSMGGGIIDDPSGDSGARTAAAGCI
jgi:hypothetical protein